jgi:ferric-dicitrate binding protein FerR (iron transport regulator)
LRRRRRQRLVWSAAAGVAAVAVGAWLLRPSFETAPVALAAVLRADGQVLVRRDGAHAWSTLARDASIFPGDALRTGADGRLALRLGDGPELRMDRATELHWRDATHGRLSLGAAYVDAGLQANHANQLLIETVAGSVRHVGTQYQVRVLDQAIDVTVREGLVRVEGPSGSHTGLAGERLHVTREHVDREAIATTAADWSWTGAIAPVFAIEGRPLHEFLEWSARETGRELHYADPADRVAAGDIVLRGSVESLTPDQALDAVLSTTPLRWHADTGQILIGESSAPPR